MRHFSLETLDYDGNEFQAVKERYWAHVYTIRKQLPHQLYQLHRNYSLHDCVIGNSASFRDGRDLGLIIEGVTNGFIADTDHCVFFLHFIDIKSGSLDRAVGREIHVAEVDLGDVGSAVLRLLHRDSECNYLEDELAFADFDFYMRDSRAPQTNRRTRPGWCGRTSTLGNEKIYYERN